MKDRRTDDPIVTAIFLARSVNKALGTTLGPWDIDQLDDALINAIVRTLQAPLAPLPTAPIIAQRKRQIRAEYWKRYNMLPPVYR